MKVSVETHKPETPWKQLRERISTLNLTQIWNLWATQSLLSCETTDIAKTHTHTLLLNNLTTCFTLTLQLELKQSHLGWARKTPEISELKSKQTKLKQTHVTGCNVHTAVPHSFAEWRVALNQENLLNRQNLEKRDRSEQVCDHWRYVNASGPAAKWRSTSSSQDDPSFRCPTLCNAQKTQHRFTDKAEY